MTVEFLSGIAFSDMVERKWTQWKHEDDAAKVRERKEKDLKKRMKKENNKRWSWDFHLAGTVPELGESSAGAGREGSWMYLVGACFDEHMENEG